MKTELFCALATMALAVSAVADDQLRNVQTELKSQGFYYGDVNGQPSSETTSAIRRYQIRNGQEVTGTLTQETLASLGMIASKPKKPAPPSTAQAKPAPPATGKPSPPVNIRRDASVEEQDQEFLRNEEGKNRDGARRGELFDAPPTPPAHPIPVPLRDPSVGAARDPSGFAPRDPSGFAPRDPSGIAPRDRSNLPPRDPPSSAPRDPSFVDPPAPLDAPSADFPVLFSGTPFANAPLTVQQDTLRRAQSLLAGRGFYRDIVDGLPGPATEEALLSYQRSARLTLTGRLDLDTLNELHLLPTTNGGAQFGFEFRLPHHVFRGVWVDRR